MSMQAVMQSRPGGRETLELGIVEKPVLGDGQLLVRVMAAGVNRADVVQREGQYPPPPGASAILGLEVAGVVESVRGPSRFQPGDAVFGLVEGGGYAEYAVLDSELAIPKPDSMSWVEAASLPEAWMTAWLNLVEVGRLAEGQALLVHAGASGVGAAAIQLARLLGARVWATAGSEEKLEYCYNLGADEAFNARQEADFGGKVKAWGGADVILDPVGGAYLEQNLSCLNLDGRLVLIGVMGGGRSEINLGRLLVKRQSLIGSTLRSQPKAVKVRLARALETEILPALRQGMVRLTLDSTYPLAAVAEAHEAMEDNRNLGKIVLTLFPVTAAS
ncbi:NAD(P)H quinone oxidoreductase, PIG3 family [Pseudogulbenkiania sp. NH8B]|uniref:NAD(P)H-quinone oxidoreductase n=1 Tax=Pseudogulbenkiania sp. (strain NH8B) TaxID=748280 RepID=UPI0002279DF6|nr:NAD(P)H-quinone oxidoreductase [Pseudogulbenkiania sp. NH8B]BAK77098.1 NAD(P)H quinone oxidoreductase, PIG3 family [Pseudogulbenkiania sp. NH8B]